MSHHIGLQVLRAKIRGFQAAGTTITARIGKAERDRKHRLWDEKRRLGTHCRYHLVAYGLLRGAPYNSIERCAPSNKLNPEALLHIMLEHAEPWDQKKNLNLASVEALLALPITVVVASAAPATVPASSLASTTTSPSPTPHKHGTALEALKRYILLGTRV